MKLRNIDIHKLISPDNKTFLTSTFQLCLSRILAARPIAYFLQTPETPWLPQQPATLTLPTAGSVVSMVWNVVLYHIRSFWFILS